MQWVSTWSRSALRAADIEPTTYSLKAMALWNKSTPTEPWTINPLGIPQKGYARRAVPTTKYALFLSYSDFNTAFAKAMTTTAGMQIRALLNSQDSTVKLWKAIGSLDWPAAVTETDWPGEFQSWIGDEYRDLLGMPTQPKKRSSGAATSPGVNAELVMHAQRRMITAQQVKLDLAKAISFITMGPGRHGR